MTKKLEDLSRLTDLTNEFMQKFVSVLDPRDYAMEQEYFINMAITAPAMLSAEILTKLAGTFRADRQELLQDYIKKILLALKWVDHKESESEQTKS